MRKFVIGGFTVLFFAVFAGSLSPDRAFALSCVEIPTVEAAYEKYDGVIVGVVDKVVRKKDHNEIRVTVKQSFKGVEQGEIAFSEDMTWGNLNGPSEVGKEYLFFLRFADGKWENPLCSPSMKFSGAAEELEFLRDKEIQLNQPEPAGDTSKDRSEVGAITAETPSSGGTGKEGSNVGVIVAVAAAVIVIASMLYKFGFIRKR